jgi:hypothetical protein
MQPLGIADMRQDERFQEQGVWGDLICTECFSIITSLCVKEAGVYEFVKVRDLDDQEPQAGHAAALLLSDLQDVSTIRDGRDALGHPV